MGASGYLLKKAVIAELKAAVQRVAGGEIYLSQEISNRLRNQLPLQQIAHARSPVEQLTERQREILQLIAEGQTTKAIALILKLSPKTVEYHRMQVDAAPQHLRHSGPGPLRRANGTDFAGILTGCLTAVHQSRAPSPRLRTVA